MKKSDLAGREMQFAWRIFPNTMTLDLKEEIADFLNVMEPNTLFPQAPYFISLIIDIEHR